MVAKELRRLSSSGGNIGRVGRGPLTPDRDGFALSICRASLPGGRELRPSVVDAPQPAEVGRWGTACFGKEQDRGLARGGPRI